MKYKKNKTVSLFNSFAPNFPGDHTWVMQSQLNVRFSFRMKSEILRQQGLIISEAVEPTVMNNKKSSHISLGSARLDLVLGTFLLLESEITRNGKLNAQCFAMHKLMFCHTESS